jgi:hypothetical protein
MMQETPTMMRINAGDDARHGDRVTARRDP